MKYGVKSLAFRDTGCEGVCTISFSKTVAGADAAIT